MEKIIEMMMEDYEGFVKPRLSLDFLPLEKAESKGKLMERIGDIALTVICVLESNEGNSIVIHLSQKLADIIGVSKENLMKDAMENMKKIASPVLTDLNYLVTGKSSEKPISLVCMDKNFISGGAVFMIPEIQNAIIDHFDGEDFYVIPSSRKELIMLKKGTVSVEPTKRFIEQVNNSDFVEESDFLSNSLFVFDTIKKQLSMCC